MDADIEVDFDGELNLIEDLPLRKLLTMQQTDTTNGT